MNASVVVSRPMIKGSICVNAHPDGCAAQLDSDIGYVEADGAINAPARVLVIGASMGLGLAARTVLGFAGGSETLGVCLERPATNSRSATAGWYYVSAFERRAIARGLRAHTVNADAFAMATKIKVADWIARNWGQVDMVVYSMATRRRFDEESGVSYNSTFKPLEGPYTDKALNLQTGEVYDLTLEGATSQDVENTVRVMGGDDWSAWIGLLAQRGLIAPGFQTLASSYQGGEPLAPTYRKATIGRAKEHLEATAVELGQRLKSFGGTARIAVMKALITQSSVALPMSALYTAILYQVMKERGLHEGAIEQSYRLFSGLSGTPLFPTDARQRMRLDDLELREDVQHEVMRRLDLVHSGNVGELGDLGGVRSDFVKLFGFGLEEVNYGDPTALQRSWAGASE